MKTVQSAAIAVTFIVVFSLNQYSIAQTLAVESKQTTVNRLLESYNKTDDPGLKFGIARDLYYVYINDDIDIAIDYLLEALDFAIVHGDDKLIAYTYSDLGHAYMKKGDFFRAFQYLDTSSDYITVKNLAQPLVINEFHRGQVYTELGLYDIAIGHFINARDLFDSIRNKWLAEYEIVKINLQTNDTTAVQRSIQYLDTIIPEPDNRVNPDYLFHYLVLAELYIETDQYDKSLEIITRVQPFVKKHNRRYYRGIMNLGLSKIRFNEGNLNEALEYALVALRLFKEQKENSYTLKALSNASDCYTELDNFSEAYRLQQEYYKLFSEVEAHHLRVITSQIQIQSSATESAENELKKSNELLRQRQYYNLALVILLIGVIILLIIVYNTSKQRNKAAELLTQINQDKDHFIGVVSHDLRSPLNSIMMLSSLIKSEIDDFDKDSIKEYNSIIYNSSRRMEYLINNMLDANKIEVGKTQITLEPTSLTEALNQVLEGIKILGNDKDIETDVSIPDKDLTVMSEQNALMRIFENLLSNAYKFSPPESTVFVEAGEADSRVFVSFKDQGPGMTDLDKTKLFRKFEKLSASPTGNEKTTGLGLFIVKNLIEEMKGEINIESVFGEGTTFTVFFQKA